MYSLIDHILIVYTHLMMVYLSIVCVCVLLLLRLCSYITNCTTFITLSQVNRTSVNVCFIKGAPLVWSAVQESYPYWSVELVDYVSLWPVQLPH